MFTSTLSGGGGLNLLPNFQKEGGLTGPQFLEEVTGKEGMTFSSGGGVKFGQFADLRGETWQERGKGYF